MRKLNNPHFFTPAKAGKLAKGITAFLTSYVLKQKPEQTEAMEKGTRIHDIFYNILIKKGQSTGLVALPTEWPTKKECGVTIDNQKKAFKEKALADGKLVFKEAERPIIEAIQMHFKVNGLMQEIMNSNYKIEVNMENEGLQIGGFIDLLTDKYIIDLKTTSRDIEPAEEAIKYNELALGSQQAIYERLICEDFSQSRKEFIFLYIQTCYPYGITFIRLEPDFMDSVKGWVWGELHPKYLKLYKDTADLIQEEGASFDLRRGCWEELIKREIYKPHEIHTAKTNSFLKKNMHYENERRTRRLLRENRDGLNSPETPNMNS